MTFREALTGIMDLHSLPVCVCQTYKTKHTRTEGRAALTQADPRAPGGQLNVTTLVWDRQVVP